MNASAGTFTKWRSFLLVHWDSNAIVAATVAKQNTHADMAIFNHMKAASSPSVSSHHIKNGSNTLEAASQRLMATSMSPANTTGNLLKRSSGFLKRVSIWVNYVCIVYSILHENEVMKVRSAVEVGSGAPKKYDVSAIIKRAPEPEVSYFSDLILLKCRLCIHESKIHGRGDSFPSTSNALLSVVGWESDNLPRCRPLGVE